MAGLLDIDMTTPEGQGFNSALMQAAAMLLTPRHRGGGIGSAFAAMPQAIQRAQEQAMRQRMFGLKEQQLGLQTAEAQRKAQSEQTKLAQIAALQKDPSIANNPVARSYLAFGAVDKALERAYPDVKPTWQTWYDQNGQKQSGWVMPGQSPQAVGSPEPIDANKVLIPDGQGGFKRNEQFIGASKEIRASGAPRHDIRINAFPKVQDEIDKGMAKSLVERHQQLVHAPAALDNIEKAKALVGRSGGFVGSFGEKKLEVVQFLNNNLGLGISPDEVASASELRSRVFMGIMENLKKMDAQPSQLQQQVMQDALGRITTDPGALPRVLDVFGDIVRNKVKIHNDQVRAAGDNNIRFAYPITIDLPAKQLPENFNASSLQKGEVYALPDGRTAEWDGFRFKVR